jgi:hypothetical protein
MRQWFTSATELLSLLVRVPTEADRFLSKAIASELEVKIAPNRELQNDIRGLTNAVKRLTWVIVFSALMGAGVILLANHFDTPGSIALILASLALLGALFSGK